MHTWEEYGNAESSLPTLLTAGRFDEVPDAAPGFGTTFF